MRSSLLQIPLAPVDSSQAALRLVIVRVYLDDFLERAPSFGEFILAQVNESEFVPGPIIIGIGSDGGLEVLQGRGNLAEIELCSSGAGVGFGIVRVLLEHIFIVINSAPG